MITSFFVLGFAATALLLFTIVAEAAAGIR
jgi:mannose/fructose/N-acetylgalactosamine-specific phosphotransferase system component IIC